MPTYSPGQIPNYTAIPSIDRTADLLEIVDISGNATYNVTPNNLVGITTGSVVSTTDSQTIQNKTLDATNSITIFASNFTIEDSSDNSKIGKFIASSITTGTTRSYTLPDRSGTLATLNGNQTFTGNNSFTGSTWSGGTIDNATVTVDSIAGHTTSNTGTVYGVSVTAGVIASAAILNSVNTAALQTNSVTAAKLATSAITLGSTLVTSNSGTLSATTTTAIGAFSTAVTIPAGGRTVQIDLYIANINPSTELNLYLSIWNGTVGSGTQVQGAVITSVGASAYLYAHVMAIHTPSAGSITYNVGYSVGSGNITYTASATSPAFLLVKAI